MEFRLFGEVEVLAAGRPLGVGTPRQQAVLAALLVDAGRPVAIETLVDRVWDENPPVEARNVLYSHLSRIRQLLRRAAVASEVEARIERRHAGYVLVVDPDLVDLVRFARLVDRGRDARVSDPDRLRALSEALALWRAPPLAALTGVWVGQIRDSWHRRRLDAAVQWARLHLGLGDPDPVITALPDLLTEYPLAEPMECALMEALHAAGRDAEAIDRYTVTRARLAEALGTDPGPELRALHGALLRGELPPPVRPGPVPPVPVLPVPVLPVPVPVAPAPRPPGLRGIPPPAQLPLDVYGFTGRESELRRLDGLLVASPVGAAVGTAAGTPARAADTAPGGAAPGGGTVLISAINGTAGVGKTALAVHWAHRVADRFSDGQLYLNLRGFDPAGPPIAPADAVRRLLVAFEIAPDRIPPDFEAQVGLYRSVLAHRRVLIVLDNARDAAQVRPLLPGARGCLVVVTSRNQLAGLVAATGALPLTLGLLSVEEARELLARRLGFDRVAAEPDAVDDIVGLCARLPLALALVAARAATRPEFGLAVVADELRQALGGLDEFADADPAADVRAVFSWSYRQLAPGAATLFRLLGLHPGPDIAAPAAASLAAVPLGEARRLLTELARAHLVTEPTPGRYALCHDLLRAYAAELARDREPDEVRAAVLHRAIGHYAHSADAADRVLNPHRDGPAALPPLPPDTVPERVEDRGQALAWFHAEHPVLVSLVHRVAGFDGYLCALAWTLNRFLAYQGQWENSIAVLRIALDAARRRADRRGIAFTQRMLGCTFLRLGRIEEAGAHLRQALDTYRVADDPIGEAHAHRHYSWLLDRQQRHREALHYAERALELFRATDHRSGQARALNAVGWFHALLGNHPDAIDHCEQALALQREVGDRYGQAETLDSLGYAYHALGQHDRAITCYQTAAELYGQFDDRYNEADTTVSLGDVHRAAGDVAAARAAWERALDVFDRIDHPDVADLRAKLTELDGHAPTGSLPRWPLN